MVAAKKLIKHTHKHIAPKTYLLHAPPAGTPVQCDIVLIHGLNSHEITCWVNEAGQLWPVTLLAEDFPGARIITTGFRTAMVKTDADDIELLGGRRDVDADAVNVLTIDDCARTIYDTITSPAVDVGGLRTDRPRPVVFVTHSLGGIVLKQLLLGLDTDEGNATGELTAPLMGLIRGAVFFSAPNFGSSAARLLQMIDGRPLGLLHGRGLAGLKRHLTSWIADDAEPSADDTSALKVATIVRSLSDANVLHLHRLNRHFLRVLTARRIRLLCFGEGQRTKGVLHVVTNASSDPLFPYRDDSGQLRPHFPHPPGEEIDAALVEHIVIPNADHGSVKEFVSRTEPGYERMTAFLREVLSDHCPLPRIPPTRAKALAEEQFPSEASRMRHHTHRLWQALEASIKSAGGAVLLPRPVLGAILVGEQLITLSQSARSIHVFYVHAWIRELSHAVRSLLNPVPGAVGPDIRGNARCMSAFERDRFRSLQVLMGRCRELLDADRMGPSRESGVPHQSHIFAMAVVMHADFVLFSRQAQCLSPLSLVAALGPTTFCEDGDDTATSLQSLTFLESLFAKAHACRAMDVAPLMRAFLVATGLQCEGLPVAAMSLDTPQEVAAYSKLRESLSDIARVWNGVAAPLSLVKLPQTRSETKEAAPAEAKRTETIVSREAMAALVACACVEWMAGVGGDVLLAGTALSECMLEVRREATTLMSATTPHGSLEALARVFLEQQRSARCSYAEVHRPAQPEHPVPGDKGHKKTAGHFRRMLNTSRLDDGRVQELLKDHLESPAAVVMQRSPALRTLWSDLHMLAFCLDAEEGMAAGSITRLGKLLGVYPSSTPRLLQHPISLVMMGADARKEAERTTGTSSNVLSWISDLATSSVRGLSPSETSYLVAELADAVYDPSIQGTAAADVHTRRQHNDSCDMFSMRLQVPVSEDIFGTVRRTISVAGAAVTHIGAHRCTNGRWSQSRIIADSGFLDPADGRLADAHARRCLFAGRYGDAIQSFRAFLEQTERFRPGRRDPYLHPALCPDARVGLAWSYVGRASVAATAKGLLHIVNNIADLHSATGVSIPWSDALTSAVCPDTILIDALREGPIDHDLERLASISGDTDMAQAIFASVLHEDPECPWALCGKGRCEALKGSVSAGVDLWRAACLHSQGRCQWASLYLGDATSPVPLALHGVLKQDPHYGELLDALPLQRHERMLYQAAGSSRAVVSAAVKADGRTGTVPANVLRHLEECAAHNIWAAALLAKYRPPTAISHQRFIRASIKALARAL